MPATQHLRVSGDFACFTRPEFSVERVSYPVMTPSAARGVLEAILWKPAIRWRVLKVSVLRPIRFTGIKRNELAVKAAPLSKAVIQSGGDYATVRIEDKRQQRNSVVLRDVDYLIEARFEMTRHVGPGDNPAKFAAMFERRLSRGQHFHQPYLGCREFLARCEPANGTEQPIDDTRDLGLMVWDVDFVRSATKKSSTVSWIDGGRTVHGHARPRLFPAKLVGGVMEVPADPEAALRDAHGLQTDDAASFGGGR